MEYDLKFEKLDMREQDIFGISFDLIMCNAHKMYSP